MADQTLTFEVKLTSKGLKQLNAQLGNVHKTAKGSKESISTLDRGLKSVAGAAKNSTSAFAKQAQGMGGLVHVYATVAANVFALSSAFLVLQRNADLQIMRKQAERLSETTGISFLQVAQNVKDATKQMLSFEDALAATNLALAGGLKTDQLTEISEIAAKAAQATGRDAAQSVQRLIQATVKGEPELADELGIIIRIQKATEDYAKSIGKATTELTTFEKQQAIANQVIERGNKAYGELEIEENPYTKLAASLSELQRQIVGMVSGPLGSLANLFVQNTELLAGVIGVLSISIAKKAIPLFQDLGRTLQRNSEERLVKATKAFDNYKNKLAEVQRGYGSIIKSNKILGKGLKDIIPKLNLDPRTAAKRSFNAGDVGKNLVDNFAKSMNQPKVRKELFSLFDQLDNEANKRISFLGATLSRKQAAVVVEALEKSDQNLTKGLKSRLDNFKDSTRGAFKTVSVYSGATVAKVKAQWAAAGAGMAQGLATGFQNGFSGITTIAKEQAKKTYLQLRVQSSREIARIGAQVAGMLTVVGGIAAGIGTVISTTFFWLTALMAIFAIGKELLNVFGLINKEQEEAIDAGNSALETYSDIYKQQEKLENLKKEEVTSSDDLVRNLRMQSSIYGEILQKQEASTAQMKALAGEWAISRVLFDGDFEKAAKLLSNQVKEYKKITGKTAVSFKPFGEYGETVTFTDNVKDLEKTLKELSKKGGKQLELFANAFTKVFITDVKTAKENVEELTSAVQAVQQTTKTFEDITSGAIQANIENTPAGKAIANFKNFYKEISTLQGPEFTEALRTHYSELSDQAKEYLNITKGLVSNQEILQAYALAYADSYTQLVGSAREESNIAAYNNQLKSNAVAISNKEVGSYLKKVELENKIKDAKIRSINADIAALRRIKNNENIQFKIKELQEQRAALTNKNVRANELLNAILEEQKLTYIDINNQLSLQTESLKLALSNAQLVQDTKGGKELNVQIAKQALLQNEIAILQQKSVEKLVEAKTLGLETVKGKQALLEAQKASYAISIKENEQIKTRYDYELKALETKLAITEKEASLLDTIKNSQDTGKQLKISTIQTQLAKQAQIFAEKQAVIKKKNLSIDQERVELLGLEVENTEKIAALRRELLDAKIRGAQGNPFTAENMELMGEKFNQIAIDFANNTISETERFIQASVDSLDNAVDKFTAAFRETGGDIGAALKAAGNAIIQTMNDAAFEQAKQTLKQLGRNILSKIFGKDIDLRTSQEKMVDYQRRIANATEQMARGGPIGTSRGPSTVPSGQNGEETESIWTTIKQKATELWDFIKDSTKGIWDSIRGQAGDIWKSISDLSTSVWESVKGIFSNMGGSGDSGGFLSSAGSMLTSFGGSIMSFGSSLFSGIGSLFAFAEGGIVGALQARTPIPAYATGTITSGPELAMIGEGKTREAVVPLPDNRSIPVQFQNQESANDGDTIININITGVEGNEQGLRRSANQVALEVSRAMQKANRRIG